MKEQLQDLKTRLGEISDLECAAAVLSWDQETYMPPGGIEARAQQLATLQTLAHARFTCDEMGQLLEELRPYAEELDYDSDDASLIRVASRHYDKERKLPEDLVAELAQKTSLGQNIWVQARQEKDFSKFQPILGEIIELVRRKAELWGYTDHIYDPLLDEFEPDMKTAEVAAIFENLKSELIPLVQAVAEQRDRVQDTVFQGTFDPEKQWAFTLEALKQIGYDFERGRQDKTAHPFTTSFSPDDVRVTNRVQPDYITGAIFGALHEGGHGMYEQGISKSLARTVLADGASSAVHESQSRLWENLVGRSREFWVYSLPRLKAYFPKQLADATVEQVYQAVNLVTPDYIRVEADELTYNFHLFLRFELEKDMMSGELAIQDLPAAWNAKMQAYLGITPPDDALGVLQDVHWSVGLFGYFPTYTLGNVLAGQFFACAQRDLPNLSEQFSTGEFAPLLAWMRQQIHVHGAKFTGPALVQRVTGGPISSEPYIAYLKQKYQELYQL